MGPGLRAAVLVLAAVAFGAVLWPGATAYAGPAAAVRVTFSGESGPLSCTSVPDSSEVRVVAGSPVTFGNALGEPARLTLDGRPGPIVADGQAVTLDFYQGSVAVRLEPACLGLLHRSFEAVTVEVAPARATSSPPAGVLPGRGPAGGVAEPAGGPVASSPPGRGAPGVGSPAASTVPYPAPSAPGVDSASEQARAAFAPDPPPQRGNGMLALVALFCALGVLVAAVRTVLAYGGR